MSRFFFVYFSFISFFALLGFPAMSAETMPGDACTAGENGLYRKSGGPEITGGHFLVCDGSTWNTVVDYADDGQILFQTDNDTGTCTAIKTGRMRYDNIGDTWNYCNGSCWKTFSGSTDVTSGLIAQWKMDETSGTTVADSVGTNTGTWNGSAAVVSTAGKLGTALQLTRASSTSGDSIRITNFTTVAPTTEITISAWVYKTNPGENNSLVRQSYDNTGPSRINIHLPSSSSGDVIWDFANSGASGRLRLTFTPSSNFPYNAWHHWVFTSSVSGSAQNIYLDGVSVASDTSASTFTQTAGHLDISDVNQNRFFTGKVDDMRIYNRALSSAEVTTLYNFTGGGCP